MEKFALTLQLKDEIISYQENRLMAIEREILSEILAAVENGDNEKLLWFAGFGDSFRKILMNVNEHRRALEFGFTEVAFNQYGWFAAPKFLEYEAIKVEESEIRIGRGPNGNWAYALSCVFGTGGSSGPLCVFCKKYPSRATALTAALNDMKQSMSSKIGSTDRTNHKQDLLIKSLKAITDLEVKMVQLTLF